MLNHCHFFFLFFLFVFFSYRSFCSLLFLFCCNASPLLVPFLPFYTTNLDKQPNDDTDTDHRMLRAKIRINFALSEWKNEFLVQILNNWSEKNIRQLKGARKGAKQDSLLSLSLFLLFVLPLFFWKPLQSLANRFLSLVDVFS